MFLKSRKQTYLVNLHAHTGIGSLGDGFGTVDLWMEELQKRSLKDHFVTDHGTLAAIPWMHSAGKEVGIKIHPGMEGYIIPEYDGYRVDDNGNRLMQGGKVFRHKYRHIVLLPINDIGWRNLIKINNISWRDGKFRDRGRFDYKTLFENNDGLICSSACISGIFAQPFLDYHYGASPHNSLHDVREEVYKLVRMFKKIFSDRLYIELMFFSFDVQLFIIKELVRIINKFGIEPIVTNDCHYPDAKYAEYREIMRESRYKSTSTNVSRENDEDNTNFICCNSWAVLSSVCIYWSG